MDESYVGQKMIADHNNIGGGVYFEPEYLEWKPRHYRFKEQGFKLYYKDITSVSMLETFKKRIIMHTASDQYTIDLYRVDTFLYLLDKGRKAAQDSGDGDVTEASVESEHPSQDNISELERLAKLHESGALTDEEFKLAKEKILAKL